MNYYVTAFSDKAQKIKAHDLGTSNYEVAILVYERWRHSGYFVKFEGKKVA